MNPVLIKIFIVKREMPKFIVKPANQEVLEYEEARFDTEISGKPEPKVEW